MLGDLKSSPIEQLRGRAASVEQGPVKLCPNVRTPLDTHAGWTGPSAQPRSPPPVCPHLPRFHHDDVLLGEYRTTKVWVSPPAHTAPVCTELACRTCVAHVSERVAALTLYTVWVWACVRVCVVQRLPHAWTELMVFPLSCVLLMLGCCSQKLQRPVFTRHICSAFKRNRMFGCDCYPRQYLHEFVNFSPPPRLSNYPACSWNGVPPSENDARGLSGTRCVFLACAVSNAFCVILLFSSPIYLSQAEFHKLNGIKRRMRIITDC